MPALGTIEPINLHRTEKSCYMILQAELERRGQKYNLSLYRVYEDRLRIELEQDSDASLWRGEFSFKSTYTPDNRATIPNFSYWPLRLHLSTEVTHIANRY